MGFVEMKMEVHMTILPVWNCMPIISLEFVIDLSNLDNIQPVVAVDFDEYIQPLSSNFNVHINQVRVEMGWITQTIWVTFWCVKWVSSTN